MDSIYKYTDYRKYIKDKIDEIKKDSKTFSYRHFNRKSGLKSSAHLKLIVDGKRNITQETIFRLCQGLTLGKREARYFEILVYFTQARTHKEKNHYYQQLLKLFPQKSAEIIESKYYKMFSHWYYIAILELVRIATFQDDPKWIAAQLKPAISVNKAKQALNDLHQMGLIQNIDSKTVTRTENMISTPEVVQSIAITIFHEQIMTLALHSLRHDPVEEKEFSSLTIAVSKEDLPQLKKMMQEFRKRVHGILESSTQIKTDIIQMNTNFFKLTKTGGTQ